MRDTALSDVAAEDSPTGGPMYRTMVLADPADLEVITLFGGGDQTIGLHRAAQLVRAKLLGDAIQGQINRDRPH